MRKKSIKICGSNLFIRYYRPEDHYLSNSNKRHNEYYGQKRGICPDLIKQIKGSYYSKATQSWSILYTKEAFIQAAFALGRW